MSTCERFADRLFDEDVRQALVARAPLAPEIHGHAVECVECGRLLAELGEEIQTVRSALTDAVPQHLGAATQAALAEAYPPRQITQIDWGPAGVWALCGGAAAVCLVILSGVGLSWAWQLLAFATAGAVALSTEVTRQALEASGC